MLLVLSISCKSDGSHRNGVSHNLNKLDFVLASIIDATFSENSPCILKLILVNQSGASAEVGIKDPCSDCAIYVFDGSGNPCRVTAYGRTRLDQRVVVASDLGVRKALHPSESIVKMSDIPPARRPALEPVFSGRGWVNMRIPVYTNDLTVDLKTALTIKTALPRDSTSQGLMIWVLDLKKVYSLEKGNYSVIANYSYHGLDGLIQAQSTPQRFTIR